MNSALCGFTIIISILSFPTHYPDHIGTDTRHDFFFPTEMRCVFRVSLFKCIFKLNVEDERKKTKLQNKRDVLVYFNNLCFPGFFLMLLNFLLPNFIFAVRELAISAPCTSYILFAYKVTVACEFHFLQSNYSNGDTPF